MSKTKQYPNTYYGWKKNAIILWNTGCDEKKRAAARHLLIGAYHEQCTSITHKSFANKQETV